MMHQKFQKPDYTLHPVTMVYTQFLKLVIIHFFHI